MILHQDVFHGGVTGGGFSTGLGLGSSNLSLFIESGSSIHKGYLFVYSQKDVISGSVILNGTQFPIEQFLELVSLTHLHTIVSPSKTYVLDITEWLINENTTIFNMETVWHPEMPYGGVFAPYLYIEYENPSLPEIATTVVINNQNMSGLNSFLLSNLNPINSNFPVGFALYTDRHSYSQDERTHVEFNDNYLGLVYGTDAVNQLWIGGVKGHFYYQNNTLYGLDDDVPNNTMNETDALADVSPYINDLSTSASIELRQIVYPVISTSAINSYLAYFLTYTSPCQPFQTSLLSSDTTTCANSPLQLGASGGINYEWLPQTNLSCYDCPNPIFLGDSTINYTVRIWASDSCSKVLPVRVRVLPQPNFESINLTESICGLSTGAIAGTSTGLSLPHTYQLNDGVPQNNFSFSDLEAGEYIITVTNFDGCSVDSTVQIIEINNVQAAFTVNPSSGAAPLQVQTQNNSQNASQYEWFWEAQSSSAFSPSILLDIAGVYTLTLVASNGASHCNDTATAFILVEEPFVVFAYTFVTDEAEVYQIFLSGVSEFRYELYALDGKLVYKKSGDISEAGHIDLWSINDMASAMYLYRIWVRDEAGNQEVVDGKVVVVR